MTLKKTGLVVTSSKGSNLRFLGRVIPRQLSEFCSSVPSFRLLGFDVCCLLTERKVGSNSLSDIGSYVEKTDGIPLSSESYQRFRSALGKVAWLLQPNKT